MADFTSTTPAKTTIVRSPASGPDPANTLAYITCQVPGVDIGLTGGWVTWTHRFRTEFKIDGFQQQNHDWYVANTIVSATAMLRFLNTTTDLIFAFGVDTIEPALAQDGTLEFELGQSNYIDDEAILFGGGEAVFEARVSAYILCFEPRTEPPRAGRQFGQWAKERIAYEHVRRKSGARPFDIKAAHDSLITLRPTASSRGDAKVEQRRRPCEDD